MTDLAGTGVQVLLIGTATHDDEAMLPSVQPVTRTFNDLQTVLRWRCGVPQEQLHALLDPPDAQTMALEVTKAASRAETVLLIYFVGHGLLDTNNKLFMAASGTDQLTPGLEEHQALSFASLQQAVSASRASSIVVILDCCFSGRASLGGRVSVPAFATAPAHGLYLIGSAEQLALAQQDAVHTSFSGAFIDVLRRGDPRGAHSLTLDAVYDAVFQRMREQHGPLPRRQSTDRSGRLIVAPNPASLRPPPEPEEPEPEPSRCPYVGLDAFDVDDADLYFGRERMVRRVLSAVAEAARCSEGPLVLVGSSGSGKSSLLNAGLLTELRASGLPDVPGSSGWPSLRFTPGQNPLRRLATQLDPGADVEALRDDPARAITLVDGLLADRSNQRLILLIDQFEELFTLCQDAAERESFLHALTALANAETPKVLVLLALRADFYGRAAEHSELVTALRDRQILVEPMTPDELRAAIERPAATAGLRLDDGLSDIILHELGVTADGQSAMGALPLLSHVLWATWTHRTGSRLTVSGYRTAGGIGQAIATTAEQVYTELDADGQKAVRHLLPRLVRVGDEHEDTAEPVELATLVHSLPDVTAARRAIRKLTEARLLTLDRDTARISHEALLRHWPRLCEWLKDDRDWLRGRQRLDDDARAWEQAGHDPSLLYRGNRLAAMRQRAAQAPAGAAELPPTCATFMEASEEQERRAAERRRRRMVLLTTLSVIAVIGCLVAVWQGQRAAQQRDLLASSSVGQVTDRLRDTDPALAMKLALTAREVADTPEARNSVFNAALSPFDTHITGHAAEVGPLEYNPQRHLLASSDTRSTVRLWETPEHGRPRAAAVIQSKGKTDLAFSPNGRLLAAGHTGKAHQLWDISDPSKPVAVAEIPGGEGALAFSPDGRRLAIVSNEAAFWDLTDPTRPVQRGTVALNTEGGKDASFSSDGRLLAVALENPPDNENADFQTELLDVADPDRPVSVAALPDTHALSVEFSPRAPLLAVSGTSGFDVWDTSDPAHPKPLDLHVPGSSTEPINTIAFSADGSKVAVGVSGSSDSFISVVPVQGDPGRIDEIMRYPTLTKINSVEFGGGSTQVFSSGADNSIHSWNPPEATKIPKHRGYSSGIIDWSFTPNNEILVVPAPENVNRSDDSFELWGKPGGPDPAGKGMITTSEDSTLDAINDRTLLEVGQLGATRLWDITDPAKPTKGGALSTVHGSLGGDDYATGGRTVAIHSSDKLIHLWDVTHSQAPAPLSTIPGRPDENDGLIDMSADGRTLFALDQGAGTIQIWNIADPRRPVKASQVNVDPRFSYLVGQIDAGSGKNRTLAILDLKINPSEVNLWNLNDLNKPAQGRTPRIAGDSFSISNNGKLLAVPTPNTVDLWDISDIQNPKRVTSLRSENQSNIEFSPDDRLLVSTTTPDSSSVGSVENTELHVWNVADPRNAVEVGTPTARGEITGLGFSPDGERLLISTTESSTTESSSQGFAYLMDLDINRLGQRFCDALDSELSDEQWERYFPGVPQRSICN